MRAILIAGLLLTACGNPLVSTPKVDDNYRPGAPTGDTGATVPVTPPLPSLGRTNGFKVSPSSGTGVGSTISARLTLLPDARFTAGPSTSARVSVMRYHPR